MSLKQKKIKFRPTLYFWISAWRGGVRIVVVVTKKIKQYIDKGYFNELFL